MKKQTKQELPINIDFTADLIAKSYVKTRRKVEKPIALPKEYY